MKQKGISQEGLKLIACVTMLIDHIGATLVFQCCEHVANDTLAMAMVHLYYIMRILGRIAFPIYCFLLVEGAHYTRNPKKYGIRLAVGALLAEIPFDLVFFGGLDFSGCSVMVTLFWGFLMILSMERTRGFWKLLVVLPFYLVAEALQTDYAGIGITIIAMLAFTKDHPREKMLRAIGFIILLWFGIEVQVGPISVPIELFGLIALWPMFSYNGSKLTHNKAVQWAFYLFYPVHLLVLWLLQYLIFG